MDGSDSHPQDNTQWNDWNGDGQDDSIPDETTISDSDDDGTNDDADTDPANPQLWNDQDRDGLNDQDEVIIFDNDGDGYANEVDSHPENSALWNDHNNDGINDEHQAPTDSDNDGISDDQDGFPYDFDNDGITDLDELTAGTNPGASDTDGDGLRDGEEAYIGSDPTNIDSDNDGLTDSEEVFAYQTLPTESTQVVTSSAGSVENSSPQEGPPTSEQVGTSDGGPVSTATMPVSSSLPPEPGASYQGDEDFGQLVTVNGIQGLKTITLIDTDQDGIPDDVEDRHAPLLNKTNPLDALGDLNANGITNVDDYLAGQDITTKVRGSGVTLDSDGDGITDIAERHYGFDPNKFEDAFGDSDGDGLLNIEEVNKLWHVSPTPKLLRNGVQISIANATDPQTGNVFVVVVPYVPNAPQNPYFNFTRGDLYEGAAIVSKWSASTNKTELIELLYRFINGTRTSASTYYNGRTTSLKLQFVSLIRTAALAIKGKSGSDRDQDGIPTLWEAHYLGSMDYRNPTDGCLDGNPMKPVPNHSGPRPTGTTTAIKAKQALWDLYTKVDPDNDGMCNLLEYQIASHPGVSESNGDFDNDGVSNRLEMESGSDFLDSRSIPNTTIVVDEGDSQQGPGGTILQPLKVKVQVNGVARGRCKVCSVKGFSLALRALRGVAA